MKAAKEWRDMTFRKETFQVMFHYYLCEDTGEKFEDETLYYLELQPGCQSVQDEASYTFFLKK